MHDTLLTEIINLCLSIDIKASKIYTDISACEKNPDLSAFWQEMSESEKEHVGFWKEILSIAGEDDLPQVFDEPVKVRDDLLKLEQRVDHLVVSCTQLSDVKEAFILAFRLEFYLLHPAFETLFHYAKISHHGSSPEDEYENHLRGFIDGMNSFGASTPELELLGETLERLWKDNKRLAVESTQDALTQVLNRHGFFRSIKKMNSLAIRNGYDVGLLMIDVDNFKKINDMYGHRTGDEVLAEVGRIIKKHIRGSDLVGRYGGEEFIVYLSQINADFLLGIAEKIRKAVETETRAGFPVTVSIGAAQAKLAREPEMELLISLADQKLYDAKNAGKNRVVC